MKTGIETCSVRRRIVVFHEIGDDANFVLFVVALALRHRNPGAATGKQERNLIFFQLNDSQEQARASHQPQFCWPRLRGLRLRTPQRDIHVSVSASAPATSAFFVLSEMSNMTGRAGAHH